MQQRRLGQSDLEVSSVALGCWAMGGWRWGGQDDEASVRAIHAAIDSGITLLDTAPIYGFGHSEQVVGEALAGRRDRVVLATKCGMVWDREAGDFFFVSDEAGNFNQDGGKKVYKYLHPDSVRAEVEASLKRLKTDRIDLMQTHWQDSTTPIDETMGALMDLKAEGKILAIGACNAEANQLEAYAAAGDLEVDQERYSMLDRKPETEQLAWCRDRGVSFLAYSPMCHGLLTGKVTPGRTYGAGDMRAQGKRFADENVRRVLNMLEDFKPVADKHRISLAQLTVAWTVAQRGVTCALVGARDEQQARENAAAGSVLLDEEDLKTIDTAIEAHAPGIE